MNIINTVCIYLYTQRLNYFLLLLHEGDIYFNGGPRTASIVRTSAYVMQDNVHIGSLTVRQTLSYAAHLRMDSNLSDSVKVVFFKLYNHIL